MIFSLNSPNFKYFPRAHLYVCYLDGFYLNWFEGKQLIYYVNQIEIKYQHSDLHTSGYT